MEKKTDIWRKYEKCLEYVDRKGIFTNTEKCWNFFIGRQWVGMKTGGEKLPVYNVIKSIVQYKVSSVASNSLTARFSDMTDSTELDEIYEQLNQFWMQSWEKSKMSEITWENLKCAAIQGDSYTYWESGDTFTPPQVIPNTDVFLADENITDIQDQPFIIIKERWSVDRAKAKARENGVPEREVERISGENAADQKQLYNAYEVEDKVTVLFYLEKKDGKVSTSRVTKSCILEPLEAVENTIDGKSLKALTIYPIIPYIWEKVPYSARGIGEVEPLIPNQIELNKTLARRIIAVKQCAYPKLAYDESALSNPEALNEVGTAVAMNGGANSISQMIAYLQPAQMSADASLLANELLQTTKDLSGVTDYAMGNINPENASGAAIQAVRDQSQVPLNEQSARLKQWVEDVSLLWADLWMAYKSEGIDFEYEKEAEEDIMLPDGTTIPMGETYKAQGHLSFDDLQKLKPTVKIDVADASDWSKLAEQQSLDNMMQTGMIDLEIYAELVPEGSPIPRKKLEKAVRIQKKRQQEMLEQQQNEMLAQQEAMTQQNEQMAQDVDPNQVFEELVNQGMPEDEAMEQVKALG